MNRDDWRLTIPVHLAEDRQQALDEARLGGGRFFREYSGESFLRKVGFDGPLESIVDYMVDNGWWIVGTPDDCVEGIKKLGEQSGGFGGFLVQAIDWAPREKVLLSFELLARYVMPQFQGSVVSTAESSRWTAERKEVLGSGRTRAIERANKAYAERDR